VRKGKTLVGKDILSLAEGVKIDTVSDVVIDPDGLRMVALIVDEGGFLSSSKVVPTEQIQSFGKDAVVVSDRQSVVSVSDHAALRALVERDDRLIGKTVFTVAGDKLGSISDVYFDEATGTIMGYEVSSGVLGDAAKGTSYLPSDEITGIGPDVIYVEPETAPKLEAQVGGVQGALQSAGEKIGQAGQAASQKLGEARESSSSASSGGKPPPEDSLIGRRTGSDVEDSTGSVLIPAGRRVRAEDVAVAERNDRIKELSASVALGGAQAAGADAKDAVGAAGDKAGSLWDQFTRKLSEVTDSTGARLDDEKTKRRLADIEDAIGRPVTKVILDREDNVVLNLGDIITHQAVQRAHEAGGLDSLLASVYKGTVELTKDEMRAPVESTSSVDKASGGAAVVEDLEKKVDESEQAKEAERQQKKAEEEANRERREEERKARQVERESAKQSREPAPTAPPPSKSQENGIPVRRQDDQKA